jgi:hypothetical protein
VAGQTPWLHATLHRHQAIQPLGLQQRRAPQLLMWPRNRLSSWRRPVPMIHVIHSWPRDAVDWERCAGSPSWPDRLITGSAGRQCRSRAGRQCRPPAPAARRGKSSGPQNDAIVLASPAVPVNPVTRGTRSLAATDITSASQATVSPIERASTSGRGPEEVSWPSRDGAGTVRGLLRRRPGTHSNPGRR